MGRGHSWLYPSFSASHTTASQWRTGREGERFDSDNVDGAFILIPPLMGSSVPVPHCPITFQRTAILETTHERRDRILLRKSPPCGEMHLFNLYDAEKENYVKWESQGREKKLSGAESISSPVSNRMFTHYDKACCYTTCH